MQGFRFHFDVLRIEWEYIWDGSSVMSYCWDGEWKIMLLFRAFESPVILINPFFSVKRMPFILIKLLNIHLLKGTSLAKASWCFATWPFIAPPTEEINAPLLLSNPAVLHLPNTVYFAHGFGFMHVTVAATPPGKHPTWQEQFSTLTGFKWRKGFL